MSRRYRVVPGIASGRQWYSRVRDLLHGLRGYAVARLDGASGLDHVLHEMGVAGSPLLWVHLNPRDAGDAVAVGNRLSEAMGRFAAGRPVRSGASLAAAVSAVLRTPMVADQALAVVTNAHMNWTASQEIVGLVGAGYSVCLVVPPYWCFGERESKPVDVLLDEGSFTVSQAEALEIGRGALPPDVLHECYVASRGQFVPYVNLVRDRLGLPGLLAPTPDGFCGYADESEPVPVEFLTMALARRGAYIDAFELCVQSGQNLAPDIVRYAAPQYVSEGLLTRLGRQIERLDPSVLRSSDDLMFWWFSSRTASNTHGSVRSIVEDYLARSEAPELRALYAAAYPGPELVEETGRALRAKCTPLTLRMHGFALVTQGPGSTGLPLLMKALRLSLAAADAEQVVAAATDIANLHIRLGAYRKGFEWASWAVDQHEVLGARDELRRLAAVGLCCYASMLVGDLESARELVSELELSDPDLGGPTAEAVRSTLGDWMVVAGDVRAAEAIYRRNLESLPIELFVVAALDLIPVVLQTRGPVEATKIGVRARAISAEADPVTRSLGELAYGLSITGSDDVGAIRCLQKVVGELRNHAEAHRRAQASIALARAHVRQGDLSAAHRALDACSDCLDGLGESGWRLLDAARNDTSELRDLLRRKRKPTRLLLFGRPQLSRDGEGVAVSLRSAECLAILVANPRGLSLQELTALLYGDKGNGSTTKALVSRVRDAVRVTSNPYRLPDALESDYADVVHLVEAGRLRDALALYVAPLLPNSDTPAVAEMRAVIHEQVRQASLRSSEPDVVYTFLRRFDSDDMELLVHLREIVGESDPVKDWVTARIRYVSQEWGLIDGS